MLVLASASPRRKELLRLVGIPFVVQPSDVDESELPSPVPRECAELLACQKALAVWRTRPEDVVLGADTIVVVEETILGKPSDAEDAARMLRLLSGRVHRVITGVCVIGPVVSGQGSVASKPALCSTRSYSSHLVLENRELSAGSESTLVTMNELSGEEIWEYIRTGEPMDKAGAYAIQGLASRWIPRIEGDYSNVVGLPVALVYEMLRGRRGEG
ncbi:MAG: Maf family protein [Candidatus Sulfotelmatobacter sp.]|jgi:septum formation protein